MKQGDIQPHCSGCDRMLECRLQAVESKRVAGIYRLKPGLQRLITELDETL